MWHIFQTGLLFREREFVVICETFRASGTRHCCNLRGIVSSGARICGILRWIVPSGARTRRILLGIAIL